VAAHTGPKKVVVVSVCGVAAHTGPTKVGVDRVFGVAAHTGPTKVVVASVSSWWGVSDGDCNPGLGPK
jgi:hypothetical protein